MSIPSNDPDLTFDDFICHVCGAETETAPLLPDRSVCPACCEDHDWYFEPSLGYKICNHCAVPMPHDYESQDY